MKIIINETKDKKELFLIDPQTGCDWVCDFIGNAGGIGCTGDNTYTLFVPDGDGAYITDAGNFDGWENVVSEMQEFENKKFCLEQKYGCDSVWHAIGDNMLCDIEFQASNGMAALRTAFPDDFSDV